jgi:hypothetical protein
MKKFLVVILALALVAGVAVISHAVNPSGPGYSGDVMGMSTGRYASDPQRTFRLVRYNAGATTTSLSSGNIVVWDTTTGFPTDADGVSVRTSTTTGDASVAGVLVTDIVSRDTTGGNHAASEDVGLKNWGWLQTYGRSAVAVTQTTTGSGGGARVAAVTEAVCCGPVAGQITSYYASASNAALNGNAGFALETFTTGSTGRIFIKCE